MYQNKQWICKGKTKESLKQRPQMDSKNQENCKTNMQKNKRKKGTH